MDKSMIREAVVHELKCHPEPYQATKRNDKPFEFRKDDRDYRVGDTLRLREWDPHWDATLTVDPYTGDELRRKVTYIIREGFGIPEGYCIMGLAELDKPGEGDPDAHLSDEAYLKAKQERFAKGGLANVDPDKYMDEVRGTGKVLTEEQLQEVAKDCTAYQMADGHVGWNKGEFDRCFSALKRHRDHGYLSAPAKAPAEVAPSPQAVTVEGRWISVDDRLPEGSVLLAGYAYNDPERGEYWQRTGFYSDGTIYHDDDFNPWEGYAPTHWMPLPSAPASTNT